MRTPARHSHASRWGIATAFALALAIATPATAQAALLAPDVPIPASTVLVGGGELPWQAATVEVTSAEEVRAARAAEIEAARQAQVASRAEALRGEGARVSEAGTTVSPVDPGSYRISSTYGPRTPPCSGCSSFHNGLDFAAPLGTPIRAVQAGVVEHVGYGDWGTHSGGIVVLRHADGTATSYNHMSSAGIYVSSGQQVQVGEVIAGVGNEGYSTGPHLHFSVYLPDGSTTEPLSWLAARGVTP